MFNFIKNTFVSVILLYKNFFHWNINKILISIWSNILSFLVALPFLILLFFVSYLFGIDIKWLFNTLLNHNLSSNLFVNIAFIFISFVFILVYTYKYILISKINLDYLKWKKTKLLKNYYYKPKILKKFILLNLLNIWLFLSLTIIFALVFVILYYVFWWIEWIQAYLWEWFKNIFSILSLLLFICYIVSFIYLIFRIIFSYFVLIENKWKKITVFDCFSKSFSLTKWYTKFLKFFSLIVIFGIFFIPSFITISFFETNMSNIDQYFAYKYGIVEEKRDDINSQSLNLMFSSYSKDELTNLYKEYSIYVLLINIFNYLVFFWMYPMILASFYKKELLKNNKNT